VRWRAALQDLSAFRPLPLNAKRLGARNASSALAVKQAQLPNWKNFALPRIDYILIFPVSTRGQTGYAEGQ
jgi:hypothetical protein